MLIKEIQVKGIVIKSNLADADYVINPYIGCQHRCIYCYAEFMKRFSNHNEEWGMFVDVKKNALDVINNIEKLRGKKVLISSVTDPYQPIEAKYKLTRKILQALVCVQPSLEILTKSKMVVRDIDVLKEYNNAIVGSSISTMNENISRKIEPLAALPRLRIDTIKRCKEAGLKTYLFLSPILPYITETEEIIEKFEKYVDYFMFENLNLKPTNRARLFKFIEKERPELLSKYKLIYNYKNNPYWINLKEEIIGLCQKYKKEARVYFNH